jgi:hypothetical protein
MIHTIEIAKDRWSSFLPKLARHVGGRPIHLEVLGRQLGDQQLATLLPLSGLNLETKGPERSSLVISARTGDGIVSHVIVRPKRMYLGQNDAGEIEWLAVEEDSEWRNIRTLVHFEHLPSLPALSDDEPPSAA